MISSKRLIRMATKWQKMDALGRRRISSTRTKKVLDTYSCNKSSVADKGHFVIYTTDQRRFVLPLAYLSNVIFQELLNMSEEVFGLSRDGPITLPCDAAFMDSIVLIIQQGVTTGLEKTLHTSISSGHCSLSASFHQGHEGQQSLVCG